MEEKLVVNYKKYLVNFVKIFKWVDLVMVVLALATFILPLEIGFRVVACLLAVFGIVAFVLMNKAQKFEMSFDNNEWTYGHVSYKYEDITDVTQTARHFEITAKGKKIVMDIMNFEVETLSEMLEVLGAHNITVKEVKDESFLTKLFSYDSMRNITLAVSLVDWLYLISTFRFTSGNIALCAFMAIIPPVFFLVFYFYNLLRGETEAVDKLHTNLFMVLFLPLIAGGLVIYANYSISTATNAVIAALAVFVVVMTLYVFLRTLTAFPKDLVMTFFLVIFSIFLVFFSSVTLPADHSYTKQATVTTKREMESRFGAGYQLNARIPGEKTKVYNVSKTSYNKYKKGDKLTVKTTVGIFGISSSKVVE